MSEMCCFCTKIEAKKNCFCNKINALCDEHFNEHISRCALCIAEIEKLKIREIVEKRNKFINSVKKEILTVTSSLIKELEKHASDAVSKLDSIIKVNKSFIEGLDYEGKERIFSTVLVKTQKTRPWIEDLRYYSEDFFVERQKTMTGGVSEKITCLSEIWNLNIQGHTDYICCLVADGNTLYTGSVDKTIKVWDTDQKVLIKTLNGHENGVKCLALCKSTNRLLSGSSDKTINIWNLSQSHLVKTIKQHTGLILCLSVNCSETVFVSGSSDCSIIVWDLARYLSLTKLVCHNDWVISLDISPSGKFLASGSKDFSVKIWDFSLSQQVKNIEGHLDAVTSVLFSRDSRYLFSSSKDTKIKVWSIPEFILVKTLSECKKPVVFMSITHDFLLSYSENYELKLWDSESLQEKNSFLARKEKITCGTVINDKVILGYNNGGVKMIKISQSSYEDFSQHAGKIEEIVTYNQSQNIASYSSGFLKLWDLTESKLISTLSSFDEVLGISKDHKELQVFLQYFS